MVTLPALALLYSSVMCSEYKKASKFSGRFLFVPYSMHATNLQLWGF